MRQGFQVQTTQSVYRGVSVRRGLEVRDKPIGFVAKPKTPDALVKLSRDGQNSQSTAGAETRDIAEDTPVASDRTVDIRTGEAAIETHLPDAAPELLPKEPIQAVIPEARIPPFGGMHGQEMAVS